MKIINYVSGTIVACSLLASAPKANALLVAFGYEFTADPGQSTAFNGSTIILRTSFYNDGIQLLGWNLVDSDIPGFQPLTINNSSIELQSFTDDSPTNWDGSFTVGNTTTTFVGFDAADGGSLSATFDPLGHWTEIGAATTVPDACSSGELLLGALGFCGLGRRFLRS